MIAMRLLFGVAALCGYTVGSPHAITSKTIKKTSTFQILALDPDDETSIGKIKAANNSLYSGPSTQGACCNQLNAEDAATFRLENEELFLYSPGNPKQQVYVEYSTNATTSTNVKSCPGCIRYLIGKQPQPENSWITGWKVDNDGKLNFRGAELILCNKYRTDWDFLVHSIDGYPDGYDDCRMVTAKASITETPTSCLYTGKDQVVTFYCL